MRLDKLFRGYFLSTKIIISFFLSLIFVGMSAYLLVNKASHFPLAVPIWFSKPWGELRLAEPSYLWILPASGLLILFINLFISYFIFKKEPILASLLIWTNPIIGLLLFYTLIKIILLVT